MHKAHNHALALFLCVCDGAQDQAKTVFASGELQKHGIGSNRVRSRAIPNSYAWNLRLMPAWTALGMSSCTPT